MPKTILTNRDIEDMTKQGMTVITLDEDTVLTDLAYEQARRLGMAVVSPHPETPPGAPVRPYLSEPQPGRFTEGAPSADGARGPLRFAESASESDLRAAVIETGRIAYQSGLMISNDGNISARMADGSILIPPSGVCKGRIEASALLVIDLDGRVLKPAANPALKPTSEQPMHLEVYRRRPDVRAVIHTHLVFANALVIARGKIRVDVIPEAAVSFGSIPVTDYAMPSSTQNAEAIRGLVAAHNVILIRNHGSLAVGKDLDEALILTERLEHVAKTLIYAELLGGANPLPKEMLEAIEQAGRRG
jgi:L-fuculose-phosphate aldolase